MSKIICFLSAKWNTLFRHLYLDKHGYFMSYKRLFIVTYSVFIQFFFVCGSNKSLNNYFLIKNLSGNIETQIDVESKFQKSTTNEHSDLKVFVLNQNNEIIDSISVYELTTTIETNYRPNPLLHYFKSRQKSNKRITAAILAFPFPFGIVGLHRIYLGTAPYVPVAYIASLGGVFGVLPFIDFCVLVLDKDETRYINNKKVFMWVN